MSSDGDRVEMMKVAFKMGLKGGVTEIGKMALNVMNYVSLSCPVFIPLKRSPKQQNYEASPKSAQWVCTA